MGNFTMSNFFTNSSIGKKLLMGITGCFLVLFLAFHATMNVIAIFSADAYNAICAFLGSNWYALLGTAVIVLAILLHVLYASLLTLQNRKARGSIRYEKTVTEQGVAWSSKNMYVLGAIIGLGLLLHLYNFWYNMMFQELLGNHTNTYGYITTDGVALIRDLFAQPAYVVIYLAWIVAMWLHLTHGIWSMFQSAGWANQRWYPRMKLIGNIVATIIMGGFAVVAIVFFIKSLMGA